MQPSLTALGVDPEAEAVYRALLTDGVASVPTLSDLLGSPPTLLAPSLDRLVELGLVRRVGDDVSIEPPEHALGSLVQRQSERLDEARAGLSQARLSVPELVADHRADRARAGEPAPEAVDGVSIIRTADFPAVLARLLDETTGELVYLRPDQWALPATQQTDAALVRELRAGRGSRALYPFSAVDPPSADVRARVEAGERVRVLPAVPARLVVLGTYAALIPERWGSPQGQRLLVRQPALVAALRILFDLLWERAEEPTGVLAGAAAAPPDPRCQLVGLLARGATDEQAARALGCSVRTVRRRVAALLVDLGATSRFQAGVEAARRGWL